MLSRGPVVPWSRGPGRDAAAVDFIAMPDALGSIGASLINVRIDRSFI